jgi:hypothetical protein
VAACVFGVRRDPLDVDDLRVIGDLCLQSVIVAADVEDYDAIGKKASRRVTVLDILGGDPVAALNVVDPALYPSSTVRVL